MTESNYTFPLLLIAFILTVGFIGVIHTLLHLKGTLRMGLAELTQAAQNVADTVTAVGISVSAEITRVETAIAALKNVQGVDPALLDPITAQLTTVSGNLTALKAALDAEQAPTA